MARILYISYDGMLEPLGQSQVLAYLEQLASVYQPVLISFEKKPDLDDKTGVEAMRSRLARRGIRWIPLAYHKTPTAPATAYDMAAGAAVAVSVALRYRVRIVHARSYVAAMMALAVKRLTGARFLFDMRGFWADERVDGALWPPGGRLYRAAKACESRLLGAADHIVTLTQASKHELTRFPALVGKTTPITVIPTCANLDRFRPQEGGSPDAPLTLGYVGSFGTWYLLDELMRFFVALSSRRPDARLLVINRGEHAEIADAARRAGIAPERFALRAAAHAEVPAQIGRMHAATALITPRYSKIASAPTKLAEYLGCGVPCVGNAGVGDMEDILDGERVGVVLHNFEPTDHEQGVAALLDLLQDRQLGHRCRATAIRRFSLSNGVAAYRTIYDDLAQV